MDILYLPDPNWHKPSSKEVRALAIQTKHSKMRKMNWNKIDEMEVSYLPSSTKKREATTPNLRGER